ncbi:phospholipase C, phosphocholine-specific [Mucilaginibacter sp. UR6-1]|uniref:phosphocholine-specific phospholipase C n=1 Tax=Mucilaginibacter sp. UR6-1 TaxID=1435643 RepID=UPI001E2C089F|nr:phospholipase C, phosphocholine-specific [Mucilaginibacter sp. UR6-1]MCC8407927.1 phospholipase C, phosphocholine-specific [Mucilaginibacter sp. UR6-1]
MADTRRDFIKKATMLAGSAGLFTVLPESIQKALAIDAEKGSTYLDAEHVVFLMQENRSFDHCYGTLQGVRGFDDPRAMRLPDKNKVWLQTNKAGETYVPFNLDIKNSKATWMQSLPHSWENQVDAHNNGKMDGWLESKKSGNKEYAHMPLTMGYYDRKDIPFYYALADAFTVCDQHFCSSLTGTSANRSYFWAGTIREKQEIGSPALVYNDQLNYRDLTAKTFPERLEEAGISWKVYQNELSLDVGFTGEEDDWLSNFTDNNLEFYKQYNVRLHKAYRDNLVKAEAKLQKELDEMKSKPQSAELITKISEKQKQLEQVIRDRAEWTQDRFDKLSDHEKSIHKRAFVTNVNHPDYHELETLSYTENGEKREVKVPKGDVLHQFRDDVKNGKLPTVSWLAASSNFSDHPSSPWYGAWYVSEVLDILTQNPEIWKKTIFILTYDENDGYFDHVAPFIPPHSAKPETGKTSAGIDTAVEHVTDAEQAQSGIPEKYRREGPIGLGYRVPMVVASPWSRGGWVNSQVFDHTSCLQFLETFLNKKKDKTIKENNISDWRRTVCGDLTSVFRPYKGEKISYPVSLNRDQTIKSIYGAKFKQAPTNFKALSNDEIAAANKQPASLSTFPKQEKGMRHSCALPYQLHADGNLNNAKDSITINMKAGSSAGAPFNVYAPGNYHHEGKAAEIMRNWAFAVKAGDEISYSWPVNAFDDGCYELELSGPNGFSRNFTGDKNDPQLLVNAMYQDTGNIELIVVNNSKTNTYTVSIADQSYKQGTQKLTVKAGQTVKQLINLQKSHSWYDFVLTIQGHDRFSRRYAGRVETGRHGYTDPLIGA